MAANALCPQCSARFTSRRELLAHMEAHRAPLRDRLRRDTVGRANYVYGYWWVGQLCPFTAA